MVTLSIGSNSCQKSITHAKYAENRYVFGGYVILTILNIEILN
jgi:hypothetical protein